MAYSIVKCVGTTYAVDWDVVERMCMSYWRTYYQLRCSETIRMSESSWYNPFSWKLPEIETLEVDWEAVRGSARRACAADMFGYSRTASSSMRDIAWDLKYKVEQIAVQRTKFVRMLKDVQSANMAAMNTAVNDYSGLVEASRFVRDAAADTVAVGSTIATGGAAAGLLGASSAMKGLGKYQDTGKVGASVLYGTGSMILGAFKVGGRTLSAAGEYTLIIAQGVLEGGTSLAAGDKFGDAVESGGLKIASVGAAQALFNANWVKKIFAKMPVPMRVWNKVRDDGVEKMFVDEANKFAERTSKKLTEKFAKAGASKGLGLVRAESGKNSEPSGSQSGYIDEVPVEQMLLLYLSIVNMEKGIGHGW